MGEWTADFQTHGRGVFSDMLLGYYWQAHFSSMQHFLSMSPGCSSMILMDDNGELIEWDGEEVWSTTTIN